MATKNVIHPKVKVSEYLKPIIENVKRSSVFDVREKKEVDKIISEMVELIKKNKEIEEDLKKTTFLT